jgi:predicted RNA binding protein YcfA (HicA-like mRNA interferase family)
VSKWEKLIEDILKLNKDLRFEDLAKALIKMGYTQSQPKGGSSHYTFRKKGCMPITLPKHKPMNKAYIELVRETVQKYLNEEG